MKQDHYTCDKCGFPIKEASRETTIEVVTGRSMDASGNGYDDDIERVDLCLKCCAKLIYALTKSYSRKEQSVADFVLKFLRGEK